MVSRNWQPPQQGERPPGPATISTPRASDPRRDPRWPRFYSPDERGVGCTQDGDLDPSNHTRTPSASRPPECERLIGSFGRGRGGRSDTRPGNRPPRCTTGAVSRPTGGRGSVANGAARGLLLPYRPPCARPPPICSLFKAFSAPARRDLARSQDRGPAANRPTPGGTSAAPRPLARPAEQLGWPVLAVTPTPVRGTPHGDPSRGDRPSCTVGAREGEAGEPRGSHASPRDRLDMARAEEALGHASAKRWGARPARWQCGAGPKKLVGDLGFWQPLGGAGREGQGERVPGLTSRAAGALATGPTDRPLSCDTCTCL